eukprot:CAMPEP_0204895066 /NCGR_PEP_ID=MMETSP1349-20130617/33805_1 /ASSEMBLY_ACC=CAM_ASM_000710 /TAXON_ID=215587 /ORGANISM="Aplanochytrium stocchinoi, Strain GSBS06" /LENGTH=99 /DNA_ID=CAMNT_0052062373 /DNA_START=212 /DNA_END=512 /DNA_ORIENTATION=-
MVWPLQKTAPTWEKLATELKGKVNVGKVDASIYRALGARYDVKGFPTLFHISDGKVRRYSGSRGLTQMDASIYRALGARYDVKGFPTLFHISDGKVGST